jgi:hypothetical protein
VYIDYEAVLEIREIINPLFQTLKRTNNFKSAKPHFSGFIFIVIINIITLMAHQFARDVRFNLNSSHGLQNYDEPLYSNMATIRLHFKL